LFTSSPFSCMPGACTEHYLSITLNTGVIGNIFVVRVVCAPVPGRSSVSLAGKDKEAAEKAMERAADLEGISYASLAEFVRDALRRRVEAINEAWRHTHPARDRMGLPEPRKKKEG